LIDITKDAQFGKMSFIYEKCNSVRSYVPKPKLDVSQLEKAAELINQAQKPYLLIGQGILLSEAENELLQFVEKTGIPVASTLLGLGAFPADHPNYVGYLGMHGNYAPNVLTNECDVLIAIGMRFDDRVTGDVSRYAKQAKVIHIDIDNAELNKIVKADVAVNADAKEALTVMINLVEQKSHESWLNEFRKLEQEENQEVISEAINPKSIELKMSEVVHMISETTKGNAIVVTDVGQHQMITSRYFKYQLPKTNITSGGLGTMGFALPAAIGAKLGAPEKEVIAIIGDGGFQMTIQELGTILQCGAAVKIVILNNNFLGMVRQWQQLFFDRRYSFTELKNPDFVKVASGYGIKGKKVTERKNVRESLAEMLLSDEAFLLEAVVENEENVFPMVTTGASVSEIILE
jgi:acetolactate synthase-1/2/3 large subunit